MNSILLIQSYYLAR